MFGGGRHQIGYANGQAPNMVLRTLFMLFSVGLCFAAFLSFYNTVFKFTAAIAGLSVAFACLRFVACLTPKPPIMLDPFGYEWPFYTVLVPLFHEENMVAPLMNALAKLDYPADKLEIFMICEQVDPKTIAAVKARVGGVFHLVIVPPGTPQTKPRALNFAMQRARGELVTIYDAEDIPHPGQLKEAARKFRNYPELGALQAPLDYANAAENNITRQFALEYAALFHVWIPFLAAIRMPFPLGGTSNHMRRTALNMIEGWDSCNVTEDADLSFRLAAVGWELGYITLPTQEEAVSNWRDWHFQRSRWMKGYMQTWVVHMQAPFAPGGLRGIARFITLQLTVGLTLISSLFHLPALILLGSYYLYKYLSGEPLNIPTPFLLSLGISYAVGIFIGMIGAVRSKKYGLIFAALFMPVYWLMLCPPTLRALWELHHSPFLWHKTEHGVKPPATQILNVENGPHPYELIG